MKKSALFWFGLQIVGFLQTFYSRAVIQRAIVVLSRIFRARFGGKVHGLCKYNPWSKQAGGFDAFSGLEL
jgi:hypothetical protein